MPELPEVEVVRRHTEPVVKGRRIVAVLLRATSQIYLTPLAQLRRGLLNRKILRLERRGKYLLFGFDDDSRLLLHLGMTGQLLVEGAKPVPRFHPPKPSPTGSALTSLFDTDRHVHLQVSFDRPGCTLIYRDTRRFGRLQLLGPQESDPRLERLGPDALGITSAHLKAEGQRRRVAIKSFLLDQSVLAGVGNIYADESLFLAGVRPDRQTSSLDDATWRALGAKIRQTLARAIVAGGTSIDDYVHPDGTSGEFQERLKVYGRTGEPCRRCRTPILRQVIGQRSSHFCPRCQG